MSNKQRWLVLSGCEGMNRDSSLSHTHTHTHTQTNSLVI